MSKKETVNTIANEGYELDFGTVLNNAFENYKKIAGLAGIGLILIGIILFVFLFAIMGIAFGFGSFFQTLSGFNPELLAGSSLFIFLGFTVLFTSLFSPVSAGFLRMAKLADYNESFGIDTIFYYYKTVHFKELFLSTLVISFFSSGGLVLLEYTGISFAGNLLNYIISFLTFLTVPLIIFSDIKAFDAITISIKLVLKQPIILLGLLIVSLIIAILGIFGLCIGIVFTIPFLFSINYIIYKQIIPIDNKIELDEIGISED